MWITALILGFAGSLHCIGMCSPLALTVTNFANAVFFNRLFYNSGRILTYAFMGSIFSSLGSIFFITQFQNLISIVLGILLLLIGVSGISHLKIPIITQSLQFLATFLKNRFSTIVKKKTMISVFLLGLINGMLPCGLSFLALTYCVTLQPADGFYFMLLFGLGTIPAMVGLTSLFVWIMNFFHWKNVKIINMSLLIASGILLISRTLIISAMQSTSVHEWADIVLCR